MSPAMFGHSGSPQNALLGSATLSPLRWCLRLFEYCWMFGAIWGVGKQNKIVVGVSVWGICRRICGWTQCNQTKFDSQKNMTCAEATLSLAECNCSYTSKSSTWLHGSDELPFLKLCIGSWQSCGDVLLCCCWVILRRPQWSSIQP